MTVYRTQLAKWGAQELENEEIVKRLEVAQANSQVTCYESQLARSLRKPRPARADSVKKYMALYASVPVASVVPRLIQAAREEVEECMDDQAAGDNA